MIRAVDLFCGAGGESTGDLPGSVGSVRNISMTEIIYIAEPLGRAKNIESYRYGH